MDVVLSQECIARLVTLDKDTGMYIFQCPQCDLFTEVAVNEVNCHIFRHAFFSNPNNKEIPISQLHPHASKEECDTLFSRGKIIGCGKPFRFVRNEDGSYRAEICGYI